VIADDLRRASLFAGASDAQLEKLAAIARPVALSRGCSVFLQGDPAAAFYLLDEGAVKVVKPFRDSQGATIRYVRPGETFGESVLFTDTYPSSTETMEPSRLYRFDTGAFRRLLLAEPELALLVIAAMARLLVLLNQRVEDLLLPVPARLARHILELCSEQATPSRCHLAYTRHELAARLGTVPETLSRTLNRFVAGGLVTVHGHDIEVVNLDGLERMAQQRVEARRGTLPAAACGAPPGQTPAKS
jgi:CRP/FNR family transcriptional regulator, dissimilatory nitrate respiration regulator